MIAAIIIIVIVVAGILAKIKEIGELLSGGTSIKNPGGSKKVNNVPKLSTDSWSFARSIEYKEEPAELRFGYQDEGIFQEFKINSRREVKWKSDVEDWKSYHPTEPFYNCPNERLNKPVAVSYDSKRLGEWMDAPDFDMIVASSDRVFAKEKDTNSFYLSLPSPLYLHKKGVNKNVVLPQSFFKLDPEIGKKDIDDLLKPHLRVDEDDEIHLATNRFPLYRSLFKFLNAFGMIKPLRDAFPNMIVQAHPYSWIKLDCRPPVGGIEVPDIYPKEFSISYQTQNPFFTYPENIKKTIDYSTVLDIGVGLSHLNEQYDTIYGGEMDIINNPVNPAVRILLLNLGLSVNTFEKLYRLLNGPIQDVGGWVDGTCIYYLLVKLNYEEHDSLELINQEEQSSPTSEIEFYFYYIEKAKNLKRQLADGNKEIDIPNTYFENAYTVLWVDEQLSFTNRWRALDPRDNKFPDISQCMVSSLSETVHGFTSSHFFNPFALGLLRSFSRMAVARQIVLINGYDSETKKHELYSIHFSWPTMDKTWRKRKLPVVGMLSSDKSHEKDSILLDTIGIREDMTIFLEGYNKGIKGRWTQKYLPSNNLETPIIEGKANHYSHKWQFYSEKTFNLMNSRFRHFGAYQSVNSKCQFYKVKINPLNNVTDLEDNIWTTFEQNNARLKAKITRRQLNYRRLAELINGLRTIIPFMFILAVILFGVSISGLTVGNMSLTLIPILVLLVITLLAIGWLRISAVSNCFPTLEKPSLYEDELRFIFKKTVSNEVIMMYADKREDKNFKLDDHVNKRIILKKLGGEETLIVDSLLPVRSQTQIASNGFVIAPAVKKTYIKSYFDSVNKLERIKIKFTSARNTDEFSSHDAFLNWIELNIERIKIGYFDTNGSLKMLLNIKRSELFININSTNQFEAVINVENDFIDFSSLRINLNEENKINLGLSVWFEGITGLVNIAEETIFE